MKKETTKREIIIKEMGKEVQLSIKLAVEKASNDSDRAKAEALLKITKAKKDAFQAKQDSKKARSEVNQFEKEAKDAKLAHKKLKKEMEETKLAIKKFVEEK